MDNKANEILNEIPQAAQTHLNMLQAIIQRMSANSASCKNWCITIVTGLIAVIFSSSKYDLFPVVLAPTLLFFALDAYYLALEKRFRDSHNSFIEKLHNNKLIVSDLFVMTPLGNGSKAILKSIFSFSVWPFYLTLFALNLFVYFYYK
jgi:hypothetical protein